MRDQASIEGCRGGHPCRLMHGLDLILTRVSVRCFFGEGQYDKTFGDS
jgi:hypothetical protein